MGHRNEPARSRHRQQLKEQFSLRSIPLVEPPSETYNLDNHFGWKVCQKCLIGDGGFPPYLLTCIYCDKPEMPRGDDGDRDKVTYVLYIRGQGEEERDVKETQTIFMTPIMTPTVSRIVESAPPPPSKKTKKAKIKHKEQPGRIIGDFYYIPIKERVMLKYDLNPEEIERGRSQGRVGKGDKSRTKPKSWQLRAGAEFPEEVLDSTDSDDLTEEEEEEEEGEGEGEDRRMVRFVENLRNYDCCSRSEGVELMASTSEKNRYLFLPAERYIKRPKPVDDEKVEKTSD